MGDQSEDSEEITVVGVEYKILKHRRQKYRCRCNEQVMTAPGPSKLIRAVATPSISRSTLQKTSTSTTCHWNAR